MAKKSTKETLQEAFGNANGTAVPSAVEKGVAQAALDPTKQAQATTAEDVNAQDTRTRLWQSLNNSYNAQREQSDKSYDQAISNMDTQLMKRGMQRSSYGMQTLANMGQEKIKAQNDIYNNQIADYQNRLNTLEQQEKEEEWKQKQFDYQKERDTIADQQWQQQFDTQNEQWKQQFDYNKMTTDQQIAYNYLMNMLESGDSPSDSLLKQAGISRKDYEQMKTSVSKISGGRGGTKKDTSTPWGALGMTEAAYAKKYPNEYKAYKAKIDGLFDEDTYGKEGFWDKVPGIIKSTVAKASK